MRSRRFRTIAASLGIATLATTGALVTGSAAQAATAACYDNEKTFSLPGKPDVWVGIELCIHHTSADRRVAHADVSWDGSFLGGKRFDGFEVLIRIERNDTVYDYEWCDFTDTINSEPSSSHWYCSVAYTSTADGGWTADGAVIYNVNNDGDGDKVWDLHGTPKVT
ncbi:hypothetical protein [Spirillospora sp. CA-128828]|uniref:hypothetical protein n=1 Tax=Spirillospora sp. CA-128828 TaxID=3240033 RepID=UPI003D937CFA